MAGISKNMLLCQTQYDSKNQESQVHTLTGVEDDTHPGTAEAPGWKGVKEDTIDDRSHDTPGLVQVVEAKEQAVCNPAPFAEYSFHLGQQHATKQKLFSQDRIKDGIHYIQCEEPPGAYQPVQDFL